jgi:hypothetical protein
MVDRLMNFSSKYRVWSWLVSFMLVSICFGSNILPFDELLSKL